MKKETREEKRQRKYNEDLAEIEKHIKAKTPWKIKIAKIKDAKLLEIAYKANQGLMEKLKPTVKAYRTKFCELERKLRKMESDYHAADSKARTIEEKLKAVQAMPHIQKRVWHSCGSRDEEFFYPLKNYQSGRISGYEIRKETNRVGRVFYHAMLTTYSGADLDKLGRLKVLVNEGNLGKIVPKIEKAHEKNEGWFSCYFEWSQEENNYVEVDGRERWQ